MSLHLPEIRLRPVTEADLGMFRRFVVEPGLIGLDWSGFRDPKAVQRRFDTEGTIRAAEFRAGQWRNGYLYSRLRTDPDPLAD